MKDNKQEGPAFLLELSDDVTLFASVIVNPINGPDAVRDLIISLGSMYASRSLPVVAVSDNKTFVQYDATLFDGENINAITVLTRNSNNLISHIHIGYTPMGAVLSIHEDISK